MNARATEGRTNGVHVDPLEGDDLGHRAADEDLGDVRPALSPAQLAFLALIAALIITVIRRLRGRRA